ncbi:hypothetical protein BS50DRAFT_648263 [Corynespora cassiicola Philippines]|uniref:Uncharacterized protein n=1 Tax=Corynespora cassiicola Philippines TaxID=1448308 RepID=A0A2T2NBZ2_CORCC|nr:hypothetical protein BS50DRAFT_648263 [Corynespora cassiicola Philippines]
MAVGLQNIAQTGRISAPGVVPVQPARRQNARTPERPPSSKHAGDAGDEMSRPCPARPARPWSPAVFAPPFACLPMLATTLDVAATVYAGSTHGDSSSGASFYAAHPPLRPHTHPNFEEHQTHRRRPSATRHAAAIAATAPIALLLLAAGCWRLAAPRCLYDVMGTAGCDWHGPQSPQSPQRPHAEAAVVKRRAIPSSQRRPDGQTVAACHLICFGPTHPPPAAILPDSTSLALLGGVDDDVRMLAPSDEPALVRP